MSKMPAIYHPWDLSPEQAIELQKQLAPGVIRKSTLKLNRVRTIAGIDTAYREGVGCAAVVVLQFEDLKTVESKTATRPINFPYVPGLLSFREGPVISEALDKLKSPPDLLMFDGQGIAHPRRFGIASHIGLLVDIPAVGCAKTKLIGKYQEPEVEQGSFTYLRDNDGTIGAVVRTRSRVKPLFVSTGHRVNLGDSIKLVLRCSTGFRLPEPIRRADKLSRERLRKPI
ncbi:MAG: deoxyribonuclease V [Desulfobacterales bacterium]